MLILFMILNSRMCIFLFIFSQRTIFSSCGVAERFERREAARRRENPIYWQGR